MSISVKISQLNEGGSVASTDQIPVSRGGIETYRIPANQFVVNASNIGVGPGQLYFDKSTGAGTTLQFRSLSGVDGLAVVNQGNTLVISASGQNPVKTSITGNGTTTTFAVNGAGSINPNNYRVDIDGVLQEPLNDYTIVGSNIVFNPAPPAGSKVTVVSNNLVRAYDIIPSDSSVTPQKLSTGGITWNTSGSVGVGGITNPLTTLDVNGVGTFRAQGLGEGGQITLMDSTGSGAWEIDNLGFGSNSLFRIFRDKGVNNVNAIVVNTLGNVGIGGPLPESSLHVAGGVLARSGAPGANGVSNNGYAFAGDGDSGMYSTADGRIEFYNNNVEVMRLQSGNVGIGTTNPQQALHVQGNVRVGDATLTQPSGSAPMFVCRAWVNFDATRNAAGVTDSANTNRFIRASGNVTSVLQVAGGDYRITFTTPMPTTDYCVTGIGSFANAVGSIGINTAEAPTTTTVRVRHGHFAGSGATGYPSSPTYGNVAIFC